MATKTNRSGSVPVRQILLNLPVMLADLVDEAVAARNKYAASPIKRTQWIGEQLAEAATKQLKEKRHGLSNRRKVKRSETSRTRKRPRTATGKAGA